MPTITIDADLCTKCGNCILVCWPSVYIKENKDSTPVPINTGSCISCGQCVAICPKDAIAHSEFPAGYVKTIISENIPSSEAVLELLRTRRSVRFFKDRSVEKPLIERIIEAARFAPSYLNLQTTEFIVVQDRRLLQNIAQATGRFFTESVTKLHNPLLRQLFSIRMRVPVKVVTKDVLLHMEHVIVETQKGRDIILYNAPILIFFHAEKRPFSSVDINASLALQNAALMAFAQGLGSIFPNPIMLACERDKSVPQLIELPENHKVYGVLAVGYPRFEFKKWPERKPPKVTWL